MARKKSGVLKLAWVRSAIGCPEKHRRVIRGLGFRRLYQVLERPDTPEIRGMVAKVPHLVKVVEA